MHFSSTNVSTSIKANTFLSHMGAASWHHDIKLAIYDLYHQLPKQTNFWVIQDLYVYVLLYFHCTDKINIEVRPFTLTLEMKLGHLLLPFHVKFSLFTFSIQYKVLPFKSIFREKEFLSLGKPSIKIYKKSVRNFWYAQFLIKHISKFQDVSIVLLLLQWKY